MTPAQKQEFLSRRKLQQKREAEEHSQRRDPEVLILEKKQTACKAYLDAKSLLEAQNAPKEKKSAHIEQSKVSKDELGVAAETMAFQQTL